MYQKGCFQEDRRIEGSSVTIINFLLFDSFDMESIYDKFCWKRSTAEYHVQQGLEIRCFWFQKNTVQLKTALCEVYTY